MVSRGLVPLLQHPLRGFHKSLPDIQAAGATLVALSPETPDNTLSTAEKSHLDFEVLSDRGNKVAHAYGVAYKVPQVIVAQSKGRLDLATHNGDNSGELPWERRTLSTAPASFVTRSSTRITGSEPSHRPWSPCCGLEKKP